MIFSVGSIFLCYNLTNLTKSKATLNDSMISVVKPLNSSSNETQKTVTDEISAVTKTIRKIVNVVEYSKFDRSITPVEKLELIPSISANKIDLVNESEEDENDVVAPHFNPDAIYIYDLKVSDYNGLYIKKATFEPDFFKNHVAVTKENRSDEEVDLGIETSKISADRVLKDGLAGFTKQDFHKALSNFNLLLERNENDVNAQFYSALSYFNLNQQSKAIERFKQVLTNKNDTFYPEAEWYLALIEWKYGDKNQAKLQLEKIVSEKGFYAKRAKDKLKLIQ
jgi:tetratricopeptide (TPR) repeat protein